MTIPAEIEKLIQLSTSAGEALKAAPSHERLAIAFTLLSDFETWHSQLAGRPEQPVLESSKSFLRRSICCASLALYQEAFSSLRACLELCMATIMFSNDEAACRIWMRGNEDIVWAKLMNSETGVLSHRFCKAFNEGFSENAPTFLTAAQTLYRELSEFTHGHFEKSSTMTGPLNFGEALYLEWVSKVEALRPLVHFALCLRYFDSTKAISKNSNLVEAINEAIGNVKSVRDLLHARSE